MTEKVNGPMSRVHPNTVAMIERKFLKEILRLKVTFLNSNYDAGAHIKIKVDPYSNDSVNAAIKRARGNK